MGGCRCLVLQAQDDPCEFVTVASSEAGDAPLLGLRVVFEDEEVSPATLTERRSMIVENLVFGAGTDHSLRSCLQVRSALFVPITSEERPIGSLLFCSQRMTSDYSAGDIACAETLAEQAASAICNARLFGDLERSRGEAQSLLQRITGLRERQRLEFASVVHDDIVQSVVAALYELEALRRTLAGGEAAKLDRASDLLRAAIGDARRYIHDLRPPVLDGLGLTGALRLLTERCEKGGIRVAAHIEEIEGLSPAATTALYMVAREALQNACRHAGARSIRLSLTTARGQTPGARDGAVALLSVSDDGVGIERPAGEDDEHFGLTMMDEQTAMAGGRLRVASEPGQGTCVEAEVPVLECDRAEE
jgi:signal transduction histidine kinase